MSYLEFEHMSEAIPAESFSKEERTWAMFTHLAAFTGHFFPLANIIAPLIIWAIKKDEMPLVDDQGKESLNFQITLTLALLISAVLCFVLIGFIIFPVVWIAGLVLIIIGAVKANDGVRYRYPFTLRFIR